MTSWVTGSPRWTSAVLTTASGWLSTRRTSAGGRVWPMRLSTVEATASGGSNEQTITAVTDASGTAAEAILRGQMGERHLAVVPAYNEAATIAGVVERLHRDAPDFDVLVVDDGSTDDTAELARARRRPRRPPPVQPRHRRRRAGRASCSRTRTATTPWSRSTATASTTRARSQTLQRAMRDDPSVDVVCGSRFLAKDLEYPAPISRRTGIHLFAFLLSRLVDGARERPDVGLPPLQPPRDRAVRPRLPARLPRGRGGADAPPPPAADARGAGADVRARRRRVVDQRARASRPTT